MRRAAVSAVNCGMEIMRSCSNFRIDFKEKEMVYEGIASLVLAPMIKTEQGSIETKAHQGVEVTQENYSYLNVHAGASCGLLLGMDIGANDRWEYVIAGEPLQDVAVAESFAEKGELAISAKMHEHFCECNHPCLEEPIEYPIELPCGCQMVSSNVYKIRSTTNQAKAPRRPKRLKALQSRESMNFGHYDDFLCMGRDAFQTIKDKASAKLARYRLANINVTNSAKSLQRGLRRSPSKYFLRQNQQIKYLEDIEHSDDRNLGNYFLDWLISTITDDFVRHTHEADRSEYIMQNASRYSCIERMHDDDIDVPDLDYFPTSSSIQTITPLASTISRNSKSVKFDLESIDLLNSDVTPVMRKSIRKFADLSLRERHMRLIQSEDMLGGELRKVIVMFINIKIKASVVSVTPVESKEDIFESDDIPSSIFLPRSKEQLLEDMAMLSDYQSCITVILNALKEVGGQLRQFIVDDKGTVCIGTFGLRGSMNVDNAATGIETARLIIKNLQKLDIGAAIGLTIGRAYCGPVGSPSRHEYACMGPSTNLSARLMGKARVGEIICDVNFRSSDSAHRFVRLGWIKAKGYTDLVPTYMPIFDESITASMAQDSVVHANRFQQLTGEGADDDCLDENVTELIGRESELKTMFDFIFLALSQDPEHYDVIFEVIYKGQKMHNRNVTARPLKVELTRIIVLEGHAGIGKSKLIKLLSQKTISYWARKLINIQLIYSKCLSFNRTNPFKSWKRLIRSMFQHIQKSVSVPEEFSKSLLNLEPREQLFAKTRFGAKHMAAQMGEHITMLLPLLTSADIISGFEDNRVTSMISSEEKLWRLEELLRDMILFYPIFANKIALFSFDDVQFMDSFSWKLLTDVWNKGKGIVLLLSTSSISDIKVLDQVHELSMQNRVSINFEVMEERTDRFLKISLHSLDFAAVKILASNIFTTFGITEVDDAIYVEIEAKSGGKPLYVIELAKAIGAKFSKCHLVDSSPIPHQTPVGDSLRSPIQRKTAIELKEIGAVKDVFQSFTSHRVEEVIYERFDKLDYQGQLLLKIAAAASVFGFHGGIPLDLFAHVLRNEKEILEDTLERSEEHKKNKASSDEVFNEDSVLEIDTSITFEPAVIDHRDSFMIDATLPRQIALQLYKIMMNDEFLSVGFPSNTSSFCEAPGMESTLDFYEYRNFPAHLLRKINSRSDISVEDLVEEYASAKFSFRVAIEVTAVYQLLLEDQRNMLHGRIAGYLTKRNAENRAHKRIEAQDLLEEALHWEHGLFWGNAMVSYFESAEILDAFGAYTESSERLASAYRMLTKMEKRAGLDNRNALKKRAISFEALWERTKAEFGSKIEIDEDKNDEYWAARQMMYDTFEGNKNLLTTGVHVMVRFAQVTHSMEEQRLVANVLYEDALYMLLLVKPYEAFGIKPPKTLINADPRLVNFCLQDPHTVFTVLIGLIMLYRTKRMIDPDSRAESSLYRLVLLFASTDERRYVVHKLKCLGLLASFKREKKAHDQSIICIEEIRVRYNHDAQIEQTLQFYSVDTGPFTLAKGAQYLMLLGHFQKSKTLTNELMQLFPKVTHVRTMAKFAFLLGSIFTMQNRTQEARDSYQIYLKFDETAVSYSFFRAVNNLYERWFNLKHIRLECEYGHKPAVFEPMDEFEQQIFQKLYIPVDSKNRPILHEQVAIYAMGIEYPCAEILYHRAVCWLLSVWPQGFNARMASGVNFQLTNEQVNVLIKAREVLLCSLQYCDFVIDAYNFNSVYLVLYVNSLIVRSDVFVCLIQIETALGNFDFADEYRELLTQNLDDCVAIARDNTFHFVLLMAGDYFEEYQLRGDYGMMLLDEAMFSILMVTEPEEYEDAFAYVDKTIRHVGRLKENLLGRIKVIRAELAVCV
jgi:hypothetical protein